MSLSRNGKIMRLGCRSVQSFEYRPCSTAGPRSRTSQAPQRINILGPGNVGQFLAHSLSALSSSICGPITLHLPNVDYLRSFRDCNNTISLTTDGILSEQRIESTDVPGSPSTDIIQNLVVTTKAASVVPAISALKHRLDSNSTILFLQNGMGVPEEVSTEVFSSEVSQPRFLQGINTHGIHGKAGKFSITHAGRGGIALSSISAHIEENSGMDGDYLQQILKQCAVLNVTIHSPTEIMELKWRKLAANAVVNPLTAIHNIPNGELLLQYWRSTVGKLIDEISAVIQALPETEMPTASKERLLPTMLQASVYRVIKETASNISSMLQDVRARKPTEINYITGYVIRRAEEFGVPCPEHCKLMAAVLAKQIF
jgi:2-dehydropantoate 2-reductase